MVGVAGLFRMESMMLAFFTNRIAVAQLVGLLFAALAVFHAIVPVTVNPANTIAVIVLAATAISAILRFSHPGEPGADAKVWWQSRTIWVQIIAAGFACATLIGYAPKADETHVLETVMTLVALVSMALGKSIAQPLSTSGTARCAPLAVAAAVAIALMVSGCAANQGGIGSTSSTALTISKATGSADSAYVAAYQTAVALVKAGKLSREDFLTWEAVAYDAVLLIRTATTIADLTAAQAQLATATAHLAPSN